MTLMKITSLPEKAKIPSTDCRIFTVTRLVDKPDFGLYRIDQNYLIA
jgi:hypothetical protein